MFLNFSAFFVTSLTLYIMQRKKWIYIPSFWCDSTEIYLQNEPKDIKKSLLCRTLFKIFLNIEI